MHATTLIVEVLSAQAWLLYKHMLHGVLFASLVCIIEQQGCCCTPADMLFVCCVSLAAELSYVYVCSHRAGGGGAGAISKQ